MNKITTTLLICGALVFTGCKKWLDVTPEGLTTKAEVFETQKGFRDALTGAYIDLKSGSAYGGALTFSTIEYLARNWDVISATNTTLTALVNANYLDAGARAALDGIYAKEYKVVADVNSILENIDSKKSIFLDDNYALIKGEALTLRAFAHFDVLRLYGPMPDSPTNSPVLPYVTEVSKNIVPLSTYDDFAKQVLADLDQAELLLKEVDPITRFSLTELNQNLSTNPNIVPVVSDDYYMYRQLRMNYNAVLALKARVYNWLKARGDSYRANAAKYAQMVIDAKDRLSNPTYRLGVLKDAQAGDYTFTAEQIAAVDVFDFNLNIEKLFGENGSMARYDFNIQDGFYYLNNLFPVAERTSDARWVGMWSYKTTAGQNQYAKYKKYNQRDPYPVNQIPLLRLSEMYLILTECALTRTEAESAYGYYCSQKGIPFNGFTASGWEADRKNKMIREYVREFYAEGQTFFTYKRYNLVSLPAFWTSAGFTGSVTRYIVPKPDREINYHNN